MRENDERDCQHRCADTEQFSIDRRIAIANADAELNNVNLPNYSYLLNFIERVAKITEEEVGNPALMLRILGDEMGALSVKCRKGR